MTAVAQVYRYVDSSRLLTGGAGPELYLATCTRELEHPHFFHGRLRRPKVTADLLIGLLQIVQSRFHIPPSMLARILREADPIVTSNGDILRFEAFSGCCSAYARVDLDDKALDGEVFRRGTTNVDFNLPMHAALSSIRQNDEVSLSVGKEDVKLTKGGESIVEKKVALPVRWLKGLLEVQAYQARMEPILEVSRVEALRFLRSLPRTSTSKTAMWVIPAGKGLRLTQSKSDRGVKVFGLERLHVLESLVHHCARMRIFQDRSTYASAWELDLGDSRFTLTISPEVWRGFSGEGQALCDLASDSRKELVSQVRAALKWQSSLDVNELSRSLSTNADEIKKSLSALGSRGLVGFDLSRECYFHRELPFDIELVDSLHPRLKNAQKLVAGDKVILRASHSDVCEFLVAGSGVDHRVKLSADHFSCSCPWFSKHQGERGPCKHVLAAQLYLEKESSGG